MKIRYGFISNSSTTSFCIYGTEIKGSMDIDSFKRIKAAYPNEWESIFKPYSEKNEWYGKILNIDKLTKEEASKMELDSEWFEVLDRLVDGFKLSAYSCGDTDQHWVGKTWASMKEDETKKQFQDGVEKILKAWFGEETKCYNIKEAWRDG